MKNKTIKTFAALMLLLIGSSFAQFKMTAGGPLNDDAHSIAQTSNGGYYMAGYTTSYGIPGQNAYLVKLTSSGAITWSKAFGGVGTDDAFSVVSTSDGGCAITGWTNSYGSGNYDIYVAKFDASGNLQWNRVIGGTDGDYGQSIIQASDGGFVVAGQTMSYGAGGMDVIILKLSSVGNILWTRTAGGFGNESGYKVIETSDGGFTVAGTTTSYGSGSTDMFIVKTNSSGMVLWSRAIGGPGYDGANSLIQLSDGSFVAAGSTMSYGAGNYDMYVVKFSSAGQINWTRTIGGSGYEFASSLVQVSDGGFIVSGSTESFGAGGSDFYTIKLNSSGVIQWQKTIGGSGDDYGYTVINTADGGFCISGYTKSYGAGGEDCFLVKFSSNGSVCGSSSSAPGSPGSGGSIGTILPLSFPYNPTSSTPSVAILSGGSASTLCLTGIEQNGSEIPDNFSLSQNYPNPFNPVTNIKFSVPRPGIVKLAVYDLTGKETAVLVNRELSAGSYTFDFDASGLASGTYLYRISAEGFTDVKKMVLIK
jgi:uncharacterized delta-60 repeat protein